MMMMQQTTAEDDPEAGNIKVAWQPQAAEASGGKRKTAAKICRDLTEAKKLCLGLLIVTLSLAVTVASLALELSSDSLTAAAREPPADPAAGDKTELQKAFDLVRTLVEAAKKLKHLHETRDQGMSTTEPNRRQDVAAAAAAEEEEEPVSKKSRGELLQ